MPKKISYKAYAEMLVDQKLIRKLRIEEVGTMPADLTLMRKVVAEKLADPAFRERFANDLLAAGALSVRAR